MTTVDLDDASALRALSIQKAVHPAVEGLAVLRGENTTRDEAGGERLGAHGGEHA